MIKIRGKELSEDTIVKACEAYGISFEPAHVFKAGDVATTFGSQRRLIVDVEGVLTSYEMGLNIPIVSGQAKFEEHNYQYVGRLTDLLPLKGY